MSHGYSACSIIWIKLTREMSPLVFLLHWRWQHLSSVSPRKWKKILLVLPTLFESLFAFQKSRKNGIFLLCFDIATADWESADPLLKAELFKTIRRLHKKLPISISSISQQSFLLYNKSKWNIVPVGPFLWYKICFNRMHWIMRTFSIVDSLFRIKRKCSCQIC